jgi:hypothetical protein
MAGSCELSMNIRVAEMKEISLFAEKLPAYLEEP